MTQMKQEQISGGFQEKRAANDVTVSQSLMAGSLAAVAELTIGHPLWSAKTLIQRGGTFTLTLNPKELYRQIRPLYNGIGPNACSMVPITALQAGLNSAMLKALFNDSDKPSGFKQFACAFSAGMGASLIASPTELIMTHQGKMGVGFYAAGKYIMQQGGLSALFNGLPATAMRDGKFAAFLLAGSPILKAKIYPYCPNEGSAALAAGIGSGVIATILSQAFDTMKTLQQAANPVESPSLKEAFKNIYASKSGVKGFFKGIEARGARVVSAITIMGAVKEKVESEFSQYNRSRP